MANEPQVSAHEVTLLKIKYVSKLLQNILHINETQLSYYQHPFLGSIESLTKLLQKRSENQGLNQKTKRAKFLETTD